MTLSAGTTMEGPATLVDDKASTVRWILLASFVLHVACFPAAGWERDINWFWLWTKNAIDFGVSHLSEHVVCDYAPAYLYVLKGMGLLWKLVTGTGVPADGTLALRSLVKLVPSLANVTTAWLLWRIALPRVGSSAALAILAGYALNPAMIFNTGFWGQIDSVVALLLVGAVFALAQRRTSLAFALLTAATLTKFQEVVLFPVFLLVAFYLERAKGLRAAYRASALTGLGLLFPFFWAHRADTVLSTAFGAAGRYPFASMNAHNIWWLVAGPRAPWTSDAMRIGNALLTYRTMGLLMFVAAMALVLARLWRGLSRPSNDVLQLLAEASALTVLAFYLFPTQMHERYIVPALALLALATIGKRALWWVYAPVSVGVFISLASSLHTWWPQNLGRFGSLFPAGQQETTVIACLFVASFFVLFFWIRDRNFLNFAIPATVMVGILLAIAVKLPVGGASRLCDWDPVEASQGWGEMHRDRSVEDHRLSVFGFIFRHGIGTHAVSRIRYHLNGAFRSFETEYAIDNEGNKGQKAQFRILVDDRVSYDSGAVPTTGVRHAEANITGAQFLTLEVLDGGDGITGDHADWLEPVLRR